MATPKPGSKSYRGPVHESVRGALDKLGISVGKKSTTRVSTNRMVMPISHADFVAQKKTYKAAASQANRQAGKYYDYDPLSSLASNSTIGAKTKAKAKVSALSRKRTRALRAGNTKVVSRATRRINRRERSKGDFA